MLSVSLYFLILYRMNQLIRWVESASLYPAIYPVLHSAKNYLSFSCLSFEIRIEYGI